MVLYFIAASVDEGIIKFHATIAEYSVELLALLGIPPLGRSAE